MDRILTLENLMGKGIYVDSNLWVLCKTQPWNGDHIFATCENSIEIRCLINRWWHNALKEDCHSRLEVFGADSNHRKANNEDLIRDAIIEAYAWMVWKGRNDAIFKGQ